MEGINNQPDQSVSSLTKSEYYQQLKTQVSENKNKGLWVSTTDSKGNKDYYLDTGKLSSKTFFTTVKTNQQSVKVPLAIKVLTGQKIALKERVEQLMDSYKQAFIDSKSHNLIMSKINGMKLAALSHVLARIGVPESELRKLRKEALEEAIDENRSLMKENVFNSELLEIVESGNIKNLKKEQQILAEIETQVMTQAQRLGIDGLYTKERIMELRIEAVEEILAKFKAEQQNLMYELEYMGT